MPSNRIQEKDYPVFVLSNINNNFTLITFPTLKKLILGMGALKLSGFRDQNLIRSWVRHFDHLRF